MVPDGFRHLAGHLDPGEQLALLAAIRNVLADAPLYVPTMPKTGRPMSVRMSNCGRLGWVTDKERGYRYQPYHPVSGRPWPAIPDMLLQLWREVCPDAPEPEACLINFYAGGARMGSHRDMDEQDLICPVLSVSLGDDAVFHVGGLARANAKTRLVLHSGDVIVLAGAARLAYHGVDRIRSATSALLPEGGRINLTLRRVTVAQGG